MEKKMTKKMIIPSVIVFIAVILIYMIGGSAVAYAEGNEVLFDSMYVLDDLEGSAVNGVTFRVEDYPYDPDGELQLIGFTEYGFSAYANLQQNFGLYVYLYNPALLDIADSMCTIQISAGSSGDYKKYYLQVVSRSEGLTENRFIKMKVSNAEKLLESLDPNQRVYYVSGIEVMTYGSSAIKEYNISEQYIFSGYAAGYGTDENAESTLQQSSSETESIEITGLLDRQTVYRDNIGNPSVTSHNQVNGVYFGLDKEYIDEFGLLQRIKAEWYEYRTTPILVFDTQATYDKFYASRGVNRFDTTCTYHVVNSTDTAPTPTGSVDTIIYYDPYFSDDADGSHTSAGGYVWYFNNPIDYLGWVIKGDGDIMHSYVVPESVLKSYREEYESDFVSSLVKDGTVSYSSYLFNTDVGEGRKAGYNVYEFDADNDAFDFTDYGVDTSTYTGWQKFKTLFGWTPETESVLKDQSPIEIVDNERYLQLSALSKADFAREMLIDESEVDKFKAYCKSELIKGRVVIHFRFACTEYEARSAHVHYEGASGVSEVGNAFAAEENVFLNFDVLSLTFKNDDGDYRIFPVVNDPIDIISGIIGPEEQPTFGDEAEDLLEDLAEKIKQFFSKSSDVFKIIGIVLAVVAVVVVIVLLIKLFSGIGGGSKSTTVVKIDPSMFKDNAKKGK